VTDGPRALQNVLSDLGEARIELHDAGMRRPTLDDVFLQLTGHHAEAEQPDDESGAAHGKKTDKKTDDADLEVAR
jgi:ABC-2 type transport system ATP-binding protein